MTKLDQIIHFVSKELRPHVNWLISDEYPQVFQQKNFHNLKFLEKSGQIVTHAALKPLIVKTPQLVLKIGAIGNVVTVKEFRNQGLSSLVIKECLTEAFKQECDLAILWTHLHDLYRKFGFELSGFEEHFTITHPLKTTTQNLIFYDHHQVDPEAILRLFYRHTITSYRTSSDIESFLKIPNTQVFTAWSSNCELKAYAIMGKGADLQGFVHEWGGNIDDLFALWNYILEKKKSSFSVLIGAHSINLITALQKQFLVGQQGFLGMIKIVHFELFTKKIKNMLRQMGVCPVEFQQLETGEILIQIADDLLKLKDEKELIQFVFGPHNYLDLRKFKTVNQIFPLPLWIWGWDSV